MDSGFSETGLGTYTYSDTPVVRQLAAAGILPHVIPVRSGSEQFVGVAILPALLEQLRSHPQMLEGPWHLLHPDVGHPRTEFRSVTGSLGPGSLQVVVNTQDGRLEADVDSHNTQDVVNIVAHLGVVLRNWWRRIRGR